MLATFLLLLFKLVSIKEWFREVVSYPVKSSWYSEQKIQATVLGHIPPVTWPLCNGILVGCNTDHVMDAYN